MDLLMKMSNSGSTLSPQPHDSQMFLSQLGSGRPATQVIVLSQLKIVIP